MLFRILGWNDFAENQRYSWTVNCNWQYQASKRRHTCMSQFCGSKSRNLSRNMLCNVGLFFVEDESLNFEDFTNLFVFLPSLFVFQILPTGVTRCWSFVTLHLTRYINWVSRGTLYIFIQLFIMDMEVLGLFKKESIIFSVIFAICSCIYDVKLFIY